jgi:alkylation response protein AidB-like acyl-CoA dehydrogenase
LLDGVRVPAANLVGEENSGWYVATSLLDFERSGAGGVGALRRDLEELVLACRGVPGGRSHPSPRYTLAERAVEIEVGRFLAYRVASIQASGGVPTAEAAAAKIYHTELSQRVANTGIRILGLYGQLMPDPPKWSRKRARFALSHMEYAGWAIAGGTNEIQRNIIATRGLGLPRE